MNRIIRKERIGKEARLLQLKIRPLWYPTPLDVDGKTGP